MTPDKGRTSEQFEKEKSEKKKRRFSNPFSAMKRRLSRKSESADAPEIEPDREAEKPKKRKGSFRKALSSVGRRFSRKSRSDSEADGTQQEERKRKGSRIGNFFRRHSGRNKSRSDSEADRDGLPGVKVNMAETFLGDDDEANVTAAFSQRVNPEPAPPSADEARRQVHALSSRVAREAQTPPLVDVKLSPGPLERQTREAVTSARVDMGAEYAASERHYQRPSELRTAQSQRPAPQSRTPESVRERSHSTHPDFEFGEPTITGRSSRLSEREDYAGSSSQATRIDYTRQERIRADQLAREALEQQRVLEQARQERLVRQEEARRAAARPVRTSLRPTAADNPARTTERPSRRASAGTSERPVKQRDSVTSPKRTTPKKDKEAVENKGFISGLFSSIFGAFKRAFSRIFQVLTCQPDKPKASRDDRDLKETLRSESGEHVNASGSKGWFSGYVPNCSLPCSGSSKEKDKRGTEEKKKSYLGC